VPTGISKQERWARRKRANHAPGQNSQPRVVGSQAAAMTAVSFPKSLGAVGGARSQIPRFDVLHCDAMRCDIAGKTMLPLSTQQIEILSFQLC
jgi:hypothetical protein